MKHGTIRSRTLILTLFAAAVALFLGGLLKSNHRPSEQASVESESKPGGSSSGTTPARAAKGNRSAREAQPVTVYSETSAAPGWSVRYGEEFWRRAASDSDASSQTLQAGGAVINPPFSVGEVVERVAHAFQENAGDSEPVVRGTTYSARATEKGLKFSPYVPAGEMADWNGGLELGAEAREAAGRPVPDSTEALISTLRVERGEEVIYAAGHGAVERAVVGNTAQGLLAPAWGVVEHFETDNEGAAVTWVFPQPLPGAGPVRVTVDVQGLSLAQQDEEGWHFADANGRARMLVGTAVAVDSAGTRWDLDVLQAPDAGDRLVVELPEAVLAEAVYPLAIDPAITPEFGMGQPVTTLSPFLELAPAIAGNASQYLVVWEDNRADSITERDVYGARVSAAGKVLDIAGIAICNTYGDQVTPAVAVLGSTFLVVWRDARLGNNDIFGARVSSAGVVLEPLGFAICATPDLQTTPAVAAGAVNFMVAWDDRRNTATTGADIYGSIVTPAGEVLFPTGFVVSNNSTTQTDPAVAPLSGGFVVAWEDSRNNAASSTDIYAARVSEAGELRDALGVIVSTALTAQQDVALAGNGGRVLAVWTDSRNTGSTGTDIYCALLGNQANQLTVADTNGVLICNAASNQRNPSVGMHGSGFCVVWGDLRTSGSTGEDVYAARVSGNGTVQDANGVPVSTNALDQSIPVVAGNSAGALIAWRDSRHTGASAFDIYGARFSTAGLVQDTNGIPLSLACAPQVEPAVAFNGTNFFVVWADSRNITNTGWDIVGATVSSAGKILQLRGTNVSSVPSNQRLPAVAASGGNFLVVWEDSRNSGTSLTDIYGARVTALGAVLDPAGLALSTQATLESTPTVAGDANTFMVAWVDYRNTGSTDSDIYGTRVSAAGAISNPTGLPLSSVNGDVLNPALTAGASGFLVAWMDDRQDSSYDIFATRITSAGTVTDPGGIAVCTDNSFQGFPSVAAHGTNFLVSWTDDRSSGETGNDIYAARVLGDASLPDGDGFAVCTLPRNQINSTVASGPNGYLVAWQDLRANGIVSEIYSARVGTNGVVLDIGGVPLPGSGAIVSPALASGGNGKFLVVGQSFRKNSDRTGGYLFTPDAPPAALYVQFKAPLYSVAENGKFAKIIIALKGKYTGTVTVDFATANWTATAGSDYGALAGQVLFANKKTSVTLTVPIYDDISSEGAEIVALRLENPSGGAVLGLNDTANLTIADNEP